MLAACFVLWFLFLPLVAAASIRLPFFGTVGQTPVEVATVPPVPNPLDERMWAIGECESHNTATSSNPHSSAKGRFQFLDGTWKYYGQKLWGEEWINKNVMDWTDNTELAYWVAETYGIGDWEASRHCWGVKLST